MKQCSIAKVFDKFNEAKWIECKTWRSKRGYSSYNTMCFVIRSIKSLGKCQISISNVSLPRYVCHDWYAMDIWNQHLTSMNETSHNLAKNLSRTSTASKIFQKRRCHLKMPLYIPEFFEINTHTNTLLHFPLHSYICNSLFGKNDKRPTKRKRFVIAEFCTCI